MADPTVQLYASENPSLPLTPEIQKKNQARLEMSNASRFVEDGRFEGAPGRIAYDAVHRDDHLTTYTDLQYETEISAIIANGGGLLLAIVLHFFFRRSYKQGNLLNPFYRTFKTLATLGSSVGQAGASFIPHLPFFGGIQSFVTSLFIDIGSLLFASTAVLYLWASRRMKRKNPDAVLKEKKQPLLKMGTVDGWSKIGKLGLTIGTSAGQASDAAYRWASQDTLNSTEINGVGGAASAGGFVGLLFVVGVYNYYTNKSLIEPDENKRDNFRTNYLRAGIAFGLAFMGCIGALIGVYALPGLGPLLGITVFGAFGSVIFGVLFGKYGKRISAYTNANWDVPIKTENSWDFGARSGLYVMSFLGAAVGVGISFICPIGALVGLSAQIAGAAIFTAVGGVIGWCGGFAAVGITRKFYEHEIHVADLPSPNMPWSQRMPFLSNVFSVVGLLIGFGVGFAFGGPVGGVLGAMIGAGIGGFIGGIVGAFYKHNEFKKAHADLKAKKEQEKEAAYAEHIATQKQQFTLIKQGPVPTPKPVDCEDEPVEIKPAPSTSSEDEDSEPESPPPLSKNRYGSFSNSFTTPLRVLHQEEGERPSIEVK